MNGIDLPVIVATVSKRMLKISPSVFHVLQHDMKLPNYFQTIILDYQSFIAEKPNHEELMDSLPSDIKSKLSLLQNRDLVRVVPVFQSLDIGIIIELMQTLQSQIFVPGEFAIQAQGASDSMFFVRSGEMDLILEDGDTIVQNLKGGDMFGHIAIVEGTAHGHGVRAVLYTETMELPCAAYHAIAGKSERFEELVGTNAIQQEQLIITARANIEKFSKLSKLQGKVRSRSRRMTPRRLTMQITKAVMVRRPSRLKQWMKSNKVFPEGLAAVAPVLESDELVDLEEGRGSPSHSSHQGLT
jgi:CRP-like cAMP-binding protein